MRFLIYYSVVNAVVLVVSYIGFSLCSDRLNNSMDVAQQRDIDIDRPSAQRWPPTAKFVQRV